LKRLVLFFATLGPAGYAPIAPATAGSAVIALIGWFIPPPALVVTICLLVVGAAISVYLCGEAERAVGHACRSWPTRGGAEPGALFVPHSIIASASRSRCSACSTCGSRSARAIRPAASASADET
jgi:hypothetical protein